MILPLGPPTDIISAFRNVVTELYETHGQYILSLCYLWIKNYSENYEGYLLYAVSVGYNIGWNWEFIVYSLANIIDPRWNWQQKKKKVTITSPSATSATCMLDLSIRR